VTGLPGPPLDWSDWSGRQHCSPARVLRPATEDELAAGVRAAASDGLVVRPVGSGHSFSPLCVTDGVQVDVSRLDRLLDVDDAGVATAQAGITLHALSAALHQRGRALENMGDVDTQTVAGALATGTHGTGGAFGNLSAQMVGGRLVTAAGTVLDLDDVADIDHPDVLRAARVSLGALGVMSELRVQTVPAFRLHKVEDVRPLTEVLEDLDELVAGHHHVELYALPWSSRSLLLRSRRTDEPAAPPPRWRTWLTDELVNNTGLGLLQRTGLRFPAATPALGRLTGVLASGSSRLDDSHRVFASNRRVRFTESEWALPREAVAVAVRAVLALIERDRLPVTFPIEVRVSAEDDALLSTASGRASAYVAVHQFAGADDTAYFREVERVMLAMDGRPHWGKKHQAGADVLAPRYPGWDRFQAVRDRLDPVGVFTNDHLAHVLGPPAALRGAG
jgi:L-gulono-1,4-lactone dehydrogenase